MPSGSYAPNAALVAGVDLRPWAGQVILRRGTHEVLLPAWSLPGEGVFEDLIDALNGRGEYNSLGDRAQAALDIASPGEWINIWLSEADRVFIECSTTFQLNGAAESVPYGWPNTPSPYYASMTGSGSWRLEAPEEWQRGAFEALNRLSIDLDPEGAKIGVLFGAGGVHQDVITSLRNSGNSPTDDEDGRGAVNLQALDCIANAQTTIMWALDALGRVVISYSTSIEDIEWVAEGLRDLLGFTGLETPETVGFYRKLTATYPPAPVLIIERLARAERSLLRDASTVRLSDGRYGFVHRGDHPRWALDFYLRGPATGRDQVSLYLARFTPAAPAGFALNFYQEWGDPRRARRAHEVNVSQSAYSMTRTAERDGRRGRILGQRAPGDEEIAPAWSHDIQVETLIKLLLDELEA
ncbi:hypothetical protein KKF91_04185 [Myxococcota bacterium]|nr:hypothetical protein [Myxococcota bacterium]